MKPITDDVVFSILKGLEKRERSKTKIPGAATHSARIFGPIGNKRIISLDVARQAKKTVSGMFCYVAKN